MRTYLWTAALVLLSAATAAAQLVPAKPKPEGGPPPEAKEQDGEPEGQKRGAPPSNAMFTAIDTDGDGVITKVELRKAMAALRTLDADGDGSITLAEASASAPPAAPAGAWGDSTQLVDQMLQSDKNGDGKLTSDEVPQDMLPMLQNADRNGDNELDRAELAAVAQNMKNYQGGQQGFGGPRGGRGNPTGKFLQYDRNGDGALSMQEIPEQMRNMFAAQDDLNSDGTLDAAELQAKFARMGGRAPGFNPGIDGKRTPGRDIEDRARKREGKLP